MEERFATNEVVVGSSPTGGTMDLCRIKIEKLKKFNRRKKPIKIALVGAENDGTGIITRHFLVNDQMEVSVSDKGERNLESDKQFIRDYFSGKLKMERVSVKK